METVLGEGLDPFLLLLHIENAVVVGIIVKHRAGMIQDHILNHLDALGVCQFHKVTIVFHPPLGVVSIELSRDRYLTGEMGIDI